MMRRRRSKKAAPESAKTAVTNSVDPDDREILRREVMKALTTDEYNRALDDPRFLEWLAQQAATETAESRPPATDDEWLARGQALRAAAQRWMGVTDAAERLPSRETPHLHPSDDPVL